MGEARHRLGDAGGDHRGERLLRPLAQGGVGGGQIVAHPLRRARQDCSYQPRQFLLCHPPATPEFGPARKQGIVVKVYLSKSAPYWDSYPNTRAIA